MDNKLDFNVTELGEEGMIQIDESTGMPIVGSLPNVVDNKKVEDKNKQPEEELLEIIDEDTKKKETPSSDDANKNPSSDNTVFQSLIGALNEKGILSSQLDMNKINDAIKEGEDPTNILFDLMAYELQTQINYYKEQLPEKIQRLINNYEEGVPLDKILQLKIEQDRLSNIPESKIKDDPEIQKEIIKRYMTEMGENETRILKNIKRLESTEELEDEALENYKALLNLYEKKEQNLRDEANAAEAKFNEEREQMLNNIKTNVMNTNEVIPGIQLNDKDRESIFSSMTKPVGVDENGTPMSSVWKTRAINPIEFEKALHYYHMIGLFNFDNRGNFKPDFSKLTKSVKNEAISELSKKLNIEDKKSSGGSLGAKNENAQSESISKIEKFLKN